MFQLKMLEKHRSQPVAICVFPEEQGCSAMVFSIMVIMFLRASLVFERFPHVPAENAGKTQIATGCDLCFSRETGLFCHGLFHNGNYVFECVFGL